MPARRAIRALEKAQEQADLSQEVKRRIETLEFCKKHGIKAAIDHAGIGLATFYNWKKRYVEFGVYGLSNGNRRPKNKRQSKIAP